MPIILIVCAFLGTLKTLSGRGGGLRIAALQSILILSVFVIIQTECLSAFQALTWQAVTTCWGLYNIIVWAGIRRHYPSRTESTPEIISKSEGRENLLMAVTAVFVLILLVTALVSPPNTWDSLTTHMSRTMHWIQNASTANYPAWVLKQLNYPPGSAFILLHFQLLSGDDRLANLPQWLAMLGGLCGVSLIALELGLGRAGQILTIIFALAAPISLLQAVSTQNEQINGLWLICFVLFLLRYRRTETLFDLCFAAIALGLSVSVKATGLMFGLPFLGWHLLRLGRKNLSSAFLSLILCLTTIITINAPWLWRNIQLTGTLIPPSETSAMINHPSGIWPVLLNLFRNLKLHAVLPGPGDPFREDVAGNLIHLLLILLAITAAFCPRCRGQNASLPRKYALCLLAGFLIFSILVRWTPFNTRYHLPLFLLSAPWLAWTMFNLFRQKALLLGFPLLMLASPWLFFNASRPWFGEYSIFKAPRDKQYFANNPSYKYSYDMVVQAIISSDCQNIGLSFRSDSWEYPLWALLKNQNFREFRIEHVDLRNESARLPYPKGDFSPCLIITDTPDERDNITIPGHHYTKSRIYPVLSLFIPDSTLSPADISTLHFRKAIQPVAFNLSAGQREGLLNAVKELTSRVTDAQQVDISSLARRDPILAEAFSQIYLNGILSLLEGIRNGDQDKVSAGIQLLQTWSDWSRSNLTRIGRIISGH